MKRAELDRLQTVIRDANPVPRPGELAGSAESAAVVRMIREATKADAPGLLSLPAADPQRSEPQRRRGGSSAMDTMERIEALESKSPPRWRNAAIAIAALVMVFAVAAVGLFAARDDSPVAGADALPTITFDGETASYRGPSTFDDNLVTFRLENNSDTIRAAFGWNLLNDESLTLEDLIAFSETYRGDNYIIPDWVEGYNQIDFYVPPNTVVEESSPEKLPTGKCTLYVWDPREAILYPAALVTVDPGRAES